MADIVKISTSNANGLAVLRAVAQLREGLAELYKINGLRGEAIAKGTAVMQAEFGVDSEVNAQALSDRIINFLEAFGNDSDADYSKLSLLRDLTNAITNS